MSSDLRSGPMLRAGLLAVGVALLAACTTSAPEPMPPPAPDPAAAGLAAYREFLRVSQDAAAAPTAKDWAAELRQLARGQALNSALGDVQNYASLSARVDGRLGSSPATDPIAPPTDARVAVLDCLDATDVRVLDGTGRELGDRANQAPRYQFRAEIVRDGDRWWVERTTPFPEETC